MKMFVIEGSDSSQMESYDWSHHLLYWIE